jgi:lambda repressor-like predicted transcriptional regulator
MSLAELAREHGVNRFTLRGRLARNGGNLESALYGPADKSPYRRGLKRLAEKHGIHPSTVSSRVNNRGWSLHKALTTPVQRHNSSFVKGELKRLAVEHGISAKTLSNRIYRGWPMEKALHTPVQKHKKYMYNGQEATLKDLSARFGISYITLQRRLKKMTLEEALNTPRIDGDKKYLYECGGRKMTLKEWAMELGCTVSGLRSRLAKSPPEIALSTPRWSTGAKAGIPAQKTGPKYTLSITPTEEALLKMNTKPEPMPNLTKILRGQIYDIGKRAYQFEGVSGKFAMFRLVLSGARESFTMTQLRDAGLMI